MRGHQQANVILIQADQWNARCLSMLGNPNVRTPNLDALAADGVLFTNASCNNPVCMPSRASMLSGQYPSTNKQFGFSGLCDPQTPWLPGLFKQGGYATAAFGKFHTVCIGQQQWQFDVAAPTLPEDVDLARPSGNHYKAYCQTHGVPWPTDQIHGHNPLGPNPGPPSSAQPDMWWMHQRACRSDVSLKDSLETWTTDRCLDFIDQQRDSNAPFFIWLTYDRPHYPTTLPAEWFDRVRPADVTLFPLPTADVLAALPPSIYRDYAGGTSIFNLGEAAFRFIVATYYTLIEYLDSEIGRLLRRLEAWKLDEQTSVIFTADHGDEAGYNGLYDKALGVASQAIVRVPLIVRPAPMLRNEPFHSRILDAPVELVDLMPTLCSLAGLDTPPETEGVDLAWAILENAPLNRARPTFCEDFHVRSIVQNGWKLVFDTVEAECQLYDLAADSYCWHNRYTDPGVQKERIELKRQLFAFLMARLHGTYYADDIDRVRSALDPLDPQLPLCTASLPGTYHFRAAAVIKSDTHEIMVPFFEDATLLFERGNPRNNDNYRTVEQAIAYDPDRVESLLDRALSDCYERIHPISLLRPRRTPRMFPSLQAAQELVARV